LEKKLKLKPIIKLKIKSVLNIYYKDYGLEIRLWNFNICTMEFPLNVTTSVRPDMFEIVNVVCNMVDGPFLISSHFGDIIPRRYRLHCLGT